MNEVNPINPNVGVTENVAEMESVDVMADAGAATSGRPVIEVIDEGQADLLSVGIQSFEDSFSSSSLTPIFSEPPLDFADAMDESDSPPKDTSSSPSLPPPSGQVGSHYEGRSLCAKAKGSLGLLVFVSPRFLCLCLAGTFCRTLQANQKGLVFAVVLPLRSLIRSPPLPPKQLHSIF